MDPRTFMENIPKSWASVDVSIYHAYLQGCNLSGAHINILVASQVVILEQAGKVKWEKLWTKPCSSSGDEENAIFREELTRLNIPKHILAQGSYCLKLEVRAESGNWKRNWDFEGAGVTKATK